MRAIIFAMSAFCIVLISCDDDSPMQHDPYQLVVTFKLDDTAERQNNLGNPVDVPQGNAAQSPDFESMGIHFLGIYSDKFTAYSDGETLLSTPTTEKGGVKAIDFENIFEFNNDDNTLRVDLKDLKPGIYEYLRSSIAFQKYAVDFNIKGANLPDGIDDDIDAKATIASFLGYNTYIEDYFLNTETISVKANKVQGYFGFETTAEISGFTFNEVIEGDAPQTTVPNPISETSPVPAGSCVVTGKFSEPLVIPAESSDDIHIEVTISTNNSFEWVDGNGNGKYEPLLGEQVVDMGTRGFFPKVQ